MVHITCTTLIVHPVVAFVISVTAVLTKHNRCKLNRPISNCKDTYITDIFCFFIRLKDIFIMPTGSFAYLGGSCNLEINATKVTRDIINPKLT